MIYEILRSDKKNFGVHPLLQSSLSSEKAKHADADRVQKPGFSVDIIFSD